MSPKTVFIYNLLDRTKSALAFISKSFFGSETQQPYSEGYIWMANQFGHFFIGFGGLFLLTWIASFYLNRSIACHSNAGPSINPNGQEPPIAGIVWTLALFWFSIWMLKEWLFDYRKGSEIAFYLVDPFLNDLFWDTATDSFFYTAGIAVAIAHFGLLSITPIRALAIVVLISAGLATYWVPARERLETAGTPYFIRLNSSDLGLNPIFNEQTRESFLDKILKEEQVRRTGLEPVIKTDLRYPFQFLMDRQKFKKQILVIGGMQLIPRFFIAITNERVIRQAVTEPCNTRFITFRNLLNSKIMKTIEDGIVKWKIETTPIPNAMIDDPACPIENAELLVVDQTPAIGIATTQIASLVTFVENNLSGSASLPRLVPATGFSKSLDIATAIWAIDPDETQRKFEIFFRSLSTKTVIWVLDNKSAAEGWTFSLQRNFPSLPIGIIEFETLE